MTLLEYMSLLDDMPFLRDVAFLGGTTATFRGTTTVAAEDCVQHRIDSVQQSRKNARETNRTAIASTALARTTSFLGDATLLNDRRLLVHIALLNDGRFLMDMAFLSDVAFLNNMAFLNNVADLLSRASAATIKQSDPRKGGAWCYRQEGSGQQA
jgi:hypothetical protein